MLLLTNPRIQTFVTKLSATWLSNITGTNVQISRINLTLRGAFSLKDLIIEDRESNPMIQAERFEFKLTGFKKKKRSVTIGGVNLQNAKIYLKRSKGSELTNIDQFLEHLTVSPADTLVVPQPKLPWKLKFKDIEVSDSRFVYIDENKMDSTNKGIDFSNTDLNEITLKANNLVIRGDTITVSIANLMMSEKSGFKLSSFSGNVRFTPHEISVDKLKAFTNNSSLNLDLKLEYPDFNAFSQFISKVKIVGTFRPTIIDMSDIGYFAPTMFTMTDVFGIEGKVSGTVDNFFAKSLDITYGENTSFIGNIDIKGLPDIYTTYFKADIQKFTTSAHDLSTFALPNSSGTIPIPEQLKTAGILQISGTYTGYPDNFISRIGLNSRFGKINADLTVTTKHTGHEIAYKGTLTANQFNVGKFLKMEKKLGETSFQLHVNGSGLSKESINLTAKGMVKSINLLGYNYENINIDGNFKQQQFEGFLAMRDENLDFNFNGLVDFNSEKPIFNFSSDIRHADLYKLNLSERNSRSELAAKMKINFTGSTFDQISGNVIIDELSYLEGEYRYTLDSLCISTLVADDGIRKIMMKSDMIDARIQGQFQLSTLPAVFASYMSTYSDVLPGQISSQRANGTIQVIDFRADLKNVDQLTRLFAPQISIAHYAELNGLFHSGDQKFDLEFCADTITLASVRFVESRIASSSDDSLMYLDITAQKTFFSEPSAQNPNGIGLDSLKMVTQFRQDSLNYHLSWNDFSDQKKNTGSIKGSFILEDINRFNNHLSYLNVIIDGEKWKINPLNTLKIQKDQLIFKNIALFNQQSAFEIEGALSKKDTDSLNLNFKKINISKIDQLFSGDNLDIDGELDGTATITGLYNIPNFLLDVSVDDLILNEEKLGNLNLTTWWNDFEQSLWVDLEINNKGNVGIGKVLSLSGNYFPARTDKNFDMELQLNNLGIRLINPFIDNIAKISQESLASGNLKISGTSSKPVAKGTINLMRTQFLINYLNAYFSLAGPINIDENIINLNDLKINDISGNPATCTGSISHNYFKNFTLDLSIAHTDFKVMNTTSRDNEQFFGNAVASGVFTISGPLDDLQMNVIARSEAGTKIQIPITLDVSIPDNDFIVFKNSNTTDEEETQTTYNVNLKGLEINLDLDVTEKAEIEIYLPYSIGTIKGIGNGDIGMNISKNGNFTMFGDYLISEGTFRFNFENLFGRTFNIRRGGIISWTGSPYDATLNMKAVYPVRTTLSGLQLQSDSSSVYNTRVDVECIIHLQNALINPDIRFSMDFKNVPENTKEIIFASLDTTDQSVMSQQFLSLLLLSNFSYTANTPSLGTTSFKLLSNQLSSWLSKLSKDVDIGIDYQPGSQLTEEELRVALRTQLFNDRLLIDGNFGVRGESRNQNTSSVVGDINVEYKITNDGRFRVKAFNRTNNLSIIENNAPYTQGLGLFYRREFDSFKDLFNKSSKNESRSSGQSDKKNDEAVLDSYKRDDD